MSVSALSYVIDLSDGVGAPFEDRSFVLVMVIIECLFCFVNRFFEHLFFFCNKKTTSMHLHIGSSDFFDNKMVDYLKKALIYGHTSRISS
jgi:hypothetical protein